MCKEPRVSLGPGALVRLHGRPTESAVASD